MPAETKEAARTAFGHRWLAAAIKTAAAPLPALPFDRAIRREPASLVAARSQAVAAR